MIKAYVNFVFFLSAIVVIPSCNTTKPEPVKLNVDNCQHCKMTIADLRFAAELITNKGRVYKFDDLSCMVSYKKENNLVDANFFVADYHQSEKFVEVEKAFFVSGGKVLSPMNGNAAAFSAKENAEKFASEKGASLTNWEQVNQ